MVKYQNPNFDKELYWKRRKAGIRGQVTPVPAKKQEKAKNGK